MSIHLRCPRVGVEMGQRIFLYVILEMGSELAPVVRLNGLRTVREHGPNLHEEVCGRLGTMIAVAARESDPRFRIDSRQSVAFHSIHKADDRIELQDAIPLWSPLFFSFSSWFLR